ncbi:nucleocapsid protein [Wufeng Rhinolophus pearsonii tupavirus 1]|uniref:Nucleoprotein n=1 Tax=Wufeng Rhinolophus pearsonii tupavirus 1 TaxID=2877511 RepID=A0AAX2ZAQ4_9RHAB|nr:nucleocapsid protein [Wufeng Rhinolophus pearsonii tupavirus 1]UBB42387.1 nucleocapsid protein [Wufeng Rhinolophus pearsonii tupavirus 1]WPV62760.1 MAG: nucleocapsid protein [Wufeng bat tupavirus 1]
MDLPQIFSKKTQATYVAAVPLDKDPPEYPAEFFKRKLEKPTVNFPRSELTLDDTRKMVKGQIRDGVLELDLTKHYLRLVLKEIREQGTEDWVSFGIRILAKGEIGNPFCMVGIIEELNQKPLDSKNVDNSATSEDDLWMTTYLLAVYRIGRAANKNYQNKLIDDVNRLMATFPGTYISMVQTLQAYDTWPADIDYCKIVACVDMFFSRFKKSKWAILRFGTISSRYKDCAALTAMNHYAKLLGVDLVDALQWSFVSRVSDEIEQMLKPGQELDKPYSYMPYMMDLGISRMSPYSSVRNPAWHLFCHTIGSLLISQRSINARHLEAPDQSNILSNAELVAYVYQTRVKWSKNFKRAGTDDDSDALGLAQTVVLTTANLPKTTNADEWFAWMKMNDFELPDECKRVVAKVARRLKDSREGSIGQFAYLRLSD